MINPEPFSKKRVCLFLINFFSVLIYKCMFALKLRHTFKSGCPGCLDNANYFGFLSTNRLERFPHLFATFLAEKQKLTTFDFRMFELRSVCLILVTTCRNEAKT